MLAVQLETSATHSFLLLLIKAEADIGERLSYVGRDEIRSA